jgi:pullulanase/glycogen debranching enzyme
MKRYRCAVPRDDYWEQSEGTPYPLGATLVENEQALNFALYSKHGEAVTLMLFGDESLTEPLLRYPFDRQLSSALRSAALGRTGKLAIQ